VELFLQSARRAYPAFEPTGNDLAHIAIIGRVVGGIPLAILLAASWVEVLRPEEILREIRANLDFLERDQRRGDDRHRSMRVVFDAAWERLGAEEREPFARMSVFRGGFTREAAQAITGASLRTLAALVRHCLLQRDPATGRYDVHELVRQYAELRLLDSGGKEEAEARHANWYGDLVQRLESRLGGADKHRARAELDTELDNVRAAWDGAVGRGDLGVIGRTVGGLATFYGLSTMNEEAVARLGAALDVVRRLPDGQRPLDLELGLQVRTAGALMNLKGYGHPDVGAGFTRAHELCQELGPSPMLAPVMFGLWAFNIIGANYATANPLARQLLAIGESAGDPVLEIGGHHASSGSCVAAGRLSEAVAHATRVMELYRPEYDPLIIAYFADHSASASRGWLCTALNAMGHLDRARAVERDMLAFIEQLGHGQTHAQGLMFLEAAASVRRDLEADAERARELRRVAVRYGLPVYVAFADAFLACTTASPAAREAMVEAAALIRDGFGFKAITVGVMVIRRAELELAAGDAQVARATVEETLRWMRAQGEHFWEAEALRVRADAERALGNALASEASYRAAIDVAREQGARLFELRAACGLGRLWQAQDRGAEARSALQPVYEAITEGRDCVDLREAATLLAELER
jgi:predicted ATPase